MKTFKTAELSHIFFHGGAQSGKCSASMSFEGEHLYSYRTRMARLLDGAVIINTRGYSVTTSKHMSWVSRAIPSGLQVFHFDGEPPTGPDTGTLLFDHAVKMAADCEALSLKARRDTVKASQLEASAKWLREAAAINQYFNLRRKVDSKTVERVRKAAEAAEKKAAAQRKERDGIRAAEREERKEREKECYQAWIKGESVSWHAFKAEDFPVAFRVESDPTDGLTLRRELVSTLGARVPLADAIRALRFVIARRYREWRKNGDTCPVGHYQLDSISGAGIIAGCHRITWAEIDRLAGMLLEPQTEVVG